MNIPLNERIDKTKLEKHPSGDGWLVPMRSGEKARIFTFNGGTGTYPIIGMSGNEIESWTNNGLVLPSENFRQDDLMLDAYIDPYAELETAKSSGKILQSRAFGYGHWIDFSADTNMRHIPIENIRIKPDWTLGDHMRRFFPTWDESTMPLHRNDFTEDMLPDGWRPATSREPMLVGDECFQLGKWNRIEENGKYTAGDFIGAALVRTRRQLPEVKRPVPLGPEDVPPGSVIRSKGINGWGAILAVNESGIWAVSKKSEKVEGPYLFAEIMVDEISRDGGKTWEACSK